MKREEVLSREARMEPRGKGKKHKHRWEIDQQTSVAFAGEFSWCRCGTLRWRRLNGGRWVYCIPRKP